MISKEEQKLIEQIHYEDDLSKCVETAAQSANPFFLYEYAQSYNWDDGFLVPTAIANNPNCDLGTALSLFWLAEAMSYFTGETERNEYNNEWANFCELIIDKLTRGSYSPGPITFKPEINKITVYKYQKDGIPTIFYEEIIGIQNN